jgi:hypothetical protein
MCHRACSRQCKADWAHWVRHQDPSVQLVECVYKTISVCVIWVCVCCHGVLRVCVSSTLGPVQLGDCSVLAAAAFLQLWLTAGLPWQQTCLDMLCAISCGLTNVVLHARSLQPGAALTSAARHPSHPMASNEDASCFILLAWGGERVLDRCRAVEHGKACMLCAVRSASLVHVTVILPIGLLCCFSLFVVAQVSSFLSTWYCSDRQVV